MARMMYDRHGGITVSDTDAVDTCRKFPQQWTLRPWIRPEGRPDVLIPNEWETMGLQARIDLARSTMVEGHGIEIENVAQADDAIRAYLAGTLPSEKGAA